MGETMGTEPLSNEELERLMEELDSAGKRLPEQALRSARAHREHVIPRLIRAIEDATTDARAGEDDIGNAAFFALFLLAEFEAKEALPAIVEAISLPGELPFDLFGDAITETLPRVLAILAGDRTDVLEELIRNRDLNEYVRWEAAGAYKFLVRDGRISRDEVVARLRQHLREAVDGRDEQIAHALVSELITFCPHEAREEIEEAFRQDLIAGWSVTMDDVRQSIAEGEERIERELSRLRPTSIDTTGELSRWYGFSDSRSSSSRAQDYWEPDAIEVDEPSFVSPDTIVSASPRVGRNDPCPCGSGRKYKKCCGAAK